MRLFPLTGDGACRTVLRAQCTALTFIGINAVGQQGLTYARRTLLIHDVSNIFFSEVLQGGQYRVRRRLSQSAQGVLLHIIRDFFDLVQIFHRRLAFCDLIQQLQQAGGANPAGGTLTAGLIHGKLQEELRDIYHTGIFVHNDQTAGAHHGADGDQVVIIDGNVIILS